MSKEQFKKLNRQQRRALNSNKAFCGKQLAGCSNAQARSILQNANAYFEENNMREAITRTKKKYAVANNRSQINE